jgi:dienelactone hydrolase
VPYVDIGRSIGRGADVAMRIPHAEGRARHADRVSAARIRVENIDEPVFLLAGGRDQTWDSGIMAANITASRTEAGRVTETLIFADAGHSLSGPPEFPASAADARARAAGWPAMLAFFERHLKDAP